MIPRSTNIHINPGEPVPRNCVFVPEVNPWGKLYMNYDLPYKIVIRGSISQIAIPKWLYKIYSLFYYRTLKVVYDFGADWPLLFETLQTIYVDKGARLKYSSLYALDREYDFVEDLEKDFPDLWANAKFVGSEEVLWR